MSSRPPRKPRVFTSTPKKGSERHDPASGFPSTMSPIIASPAESNRSETFLPSPARQKPSTAPSQRALHAEKSGISHSSKLSGSHLSASKLSAKDELDVESKRHRFGDSHKQALDISTLSLMPLTEQFPSLTEMKQVKSEEITEKFFTDQTEYGKSFWFPELVTRLGVDPSNMGRVMKMFDDTSAEYGVSDLRAEAFLSPGDGKEGDVSGLWEGEVSENRYGKNNFGLAAIREDDDEAESSSDEENVFVGDAWMTNKSGFVDTSIPNFHRARIYASGRRRGTVGVIEELSRMKSDLEEKITDHQFKISMLKDTATSVDKAAVKFNEISTDLKKKLNGLLEEFEDYESSASEWQVMKKNTEAGLKSLAELRSHLELLDKSEQYDLRDNATAKEFEVYLENLHSLAPTRTYLVRLAPDHHLVKRLDQILKIGTEKILFRFQQTLSNSDLKSILLGDAIRVELEKQGEEEEVPFAVEPVELIDYSNSAYEQLTLMSSYLTECRKVAATKDVDFTHVYYQIRDEIMGRSLKSFAAYLVHSNDCWILSPFGHQLRKLDDAGDFLRGSVSTSSSGTLRRTTEEARKKKKMGAKIASSGGKSHVATLDNQTVLELDHFVVTALGVLKLVQVEASLARDFIPEADQALVFERIISGCMIQLVEQAKKVVKKVSSFHDGHDYQSVLYVLNAMSQLEKVQPAYERQLSVVSELNYTRWLDVLGLFESSAWQGIEMFLEGIRRPESTTVPSDGAVHELAIRAMALISNMHTWSDLCSRLFANRARREEDLSHFGPEEAFPRYLGTILSILNSTMVARSHMYTDQYMACIFRINNHYYILKALQSSASLLEAIKRVEPGIEQYLLGQIHHSQLEYQRCWGTLLEATRDLLNQDIAVSPLRKGYQSQSELSSKERDLMKSRCTVIKRELDEIYKKQIEYNVPDPAVRNELIQMNREVVGRQYQSFYENYIHLDFTSNKKKYMPFSPEDVENMLSHLFSGGAKNIPAAIS